VLLLREARAARDRMTNEERKRERIQNLAFQAVQAARVLGRACGEESKIGDEEEARSRSSAESGLGVMNVSDRAETVPGLRWLRLLLRDGGAMAVRVHPAESMSGLHHWLRGVVAAAAPAQSEDPEPQM